MKETKLKLQTDLIKLIVNKYLNNTTLIINKDTIVVEILTNKYGNSDIYKAIDIEVENNKYKILKYKNKENIYTNLQGIENIILELIKEEQEWSKI